jgi:predicted PurR-regulated permease PerM
VATFISLYLCWSMLQPFIDVLLWAIVLVIVFYPVHKRIQTRLKSPTWSALVSCLLVVVMILAPMTLITYAIVRELGGFTQNLQANVESLLASPTVERVMQWVQPYVDVDQLRSQQFIVDRLRTLSVSIANRTLGFVGGLLGFVIQIFFVLFTMYYLFRDADRLRAALRFSLPLEGSKASEILDRTRDVISASVYGVLVIATIQGTLGGFIFLILGLPSALLWGVVMLFFSMIPMAGSFIVWVPAAIYLMLTGHWTKAVILVAFGTLIIGSVDNFLRPKLIGEKTRLHELLIFFSVLGGLQVFGVLGLVLGPVVVAVTMALLDVVRQADAPAATASALGPNTNLLEEQAELRNVPEDAPSTP